MLAQNFKTPAELDLTSAEFDALYKALGMLERGEIEQDHFTMAATAKVAPGGCSTPGCILGWANHIAGQALFFDKIDYSDPLADLFLYKNSDAFRRNFAAPNSPSVDAVTTAQASIALRNYLTHGESRWDEVLAD